MHVNRLRWILALISLAAEPLPAATPTIDASSVESLDASAKQMKASMDAETLQRFQAAYPLVLRDAFCPASPERPNTLAIISQEVKLKAVIHGKSAIDIIGAGARVQATLDAERAAMREQPPDSPMGAAIRAAVRQYLDSVAVDFESYVPLFPFWTRQRVAFAEELKPSFVGPWLDEFPGMKPDLPHHRRISPLMLLEASTFGKLQITKVVATSTKAYVFIGSPEKSMRTTFLLESGQWKAHADFFGYPWSLEGTESPECVER